MAPPKKLTAGQQPATPDPVTEQEQSAAPNVKTIVRIKRPWMCYVNGDITGVEPSLAEKIIASGTAERYTEE